MSRMCILNNETGVTLTETLFSVLIISFVLVGILVIFVHTVDISRRIDKEYVAENLAKNRLERAESIKATSGFDSLAALGEADTMIDIDEPSDGVDDFRRSTKVTTNYNGSPKLTKIDVSVVYKYRDAWKEDAGVVMTAIFADVE